MEQIDLSFKGQKLRLFLRNEADRSVMREIFKLREYRRTEEIIEKATFPIVDVGAHAGFFTLYCRVLNPKVRVLAVEPSKENIKMLKKRLIENKIRGVDVAEGALAGEGGTRRVLITEDGHNNRLLASGAKDGETTEAWTFGDFCKKWKIKKVSLLKLDVEGAEGEIFRSFKKSDWARTGAIILEYHGGAKKDIENMLRQNGFGVQIFPSKFDKELGFIFAVNKRTNNPNLQILSESTNTESTKL